MPANDHVNLSSICSLCSRESQTNSLKSTENTIDAGQISISHDDQMCNQGQSFFSRNKSWCHKLVT